jgi:hypothetical protein
MPSATPVPRGPAVLTLYTAADLLTGPGCPVCRYADEAGDRYLAWFALEGHADAVTITRLCASLGMCSRHTRGLMSQPGAARRLTAVYRYVVEAARDRLSGRAASIGTCPACEHDRGVVGRALDTLREGLTDDSVRDRCRELGGLCIPHLRMATVRGDHRSVTCLSHTMTAVLALLAWQADCLAVTVSRQPASSARRMLRVPASWIPPHRRTDRLDGCPVYAWPARLRRGGRSMISARLCEPPIGFRAATRPCVSGICWGAAADLLAVLCRGLVEQAHHVTQRRFPVGQFSFHLLGLGCGRFA